METVIKSGTILENHKWKVKVSLETFEKVGTRKFSKRAVRKIVEYIDDNFEELMKAWEELHGKV